MKNYMGEEVEPRKLSFRWVAPHLEVLVDGHWQGMVSPNGWQGDTLNIHHHFGEPVMTDLHLWSDMSLCEMGAIRREWDLHMEDFRSTLICVGQLAKVKKITFAEALEHLKAKKVELFRPMDVTDAAQYCRVHGIPWEEKT